MSGNEKDFSYIGNELELFENATNWKNYVFDKIYEFVGARRLSLEVGSGIGANSIYIKKFSKNYVGIEPDINLMEKAKIKYSELSFVHGFFNPNLLEENQKPDLILLIDVLEHIENDRLELNKIWKYMDSGSSLVLLVPAHQILFSKFDQSVGHYRRYSKSSVKKLFAEFECELHLVELDSVGFFLSLLSKFLNPEGKMSIHKVQLWDSLISISRQFDKALRFNLGKSLLVTVHK